MLLLNIFPSLVDLSTDLAQAVTLLISQVLDFTHFQISHIFRFHAVLDFTDFRRPIPRVRASVIFQEQAGVQDRGELRMYGFVVLAAAWAPGILTLVTFILLDSVEVVI